MRVKKMNLLGWEENIYRKKYIGVYGKNGLKKERKEKKV
jgi:hypothetical protein